MNLLIFSLGKKGFNVIQSLAQSSIPISIECVIGKDSRVLDDYSSKLINFCDKSKIKYYFRDNYPSLMKAYDFYIAAGWRWMIRDLPLEKLIILHDSLLPKYRGFAPLVNALLNKEKTIGVTAFLAKNEYDKGNILLQLGIDVQYPTHIDFEIQRISNLYSRIALELIKGLADGSIDKNGRPQNELEASYSLWRGEEDYKITWADSAEYISHFINCLGTPYRGASTLLDSQFLRVLKARVINDVKIENRVPGKVIFINGIYPVVVCGEGLLLLEEVKNEKGDSILPLKSLRSRFC